MKSISCLPIQYSAGVKADVSQGGDNTKGTGSLKAAPVETIASPTIFQTRLNERIIDVYERSQEKNVVVPDERTGVDRRRPATQQRSFPEAAPLQAGEKILNINSILTIQTYKKTQENKLTFFSSSSDSGRFIDVWA